MNEHANIKVPTTVSVAEAKARLAELLSKAASGEEIHVTKHGKPYVIFSPDKPKAAELPRVGAFDGEFELPDNWDVIPTGFEEYT